LLLNNVEKLCSAISSQNTVKAAIPIQYSKLCANPLLTFCNLTTTANSEFIVFISAGIFCLSYFVDLKRCPKLNAEEGKTKYRPEPKQELFSRKNNQKNKF
jgi:hypothetical protein